MSKKHFVALARALAETRPQIDDDLYVAHTRQWECDVNAIADACSYANPRFDRGRFTAACGLNKGAR